MLANEIAGWEIVPNYFCRVCYMPARTSPNGICWGLRSVCSWTTSGLGTAGSRRRTGSRDRGASLAGLVEVAFGLQTVPGGIGADYGAWAGGIFGVRIQVGFDVQIRLFPKCPWHCQKVLFFESLAAIVGNDLTKNEQAQALAILIETLNNETEHDEGGWICLHTPIT